MAIWGITGLKTFLPQDITKGNKPPETRVNNIPDNQTLEYFRYWNYHMTIQNNYV